MQFDFLRSDEATLVLGGIVVLAALGWGLRSHYKNRPNPIELERRRRAMINAHGKMGDAQIVEVQGTVAIYCYGVRGVEYTASQDFSALQSIVPADPWTIIGPASLKYDPRNPANSIIVSEKWSGIRSR